MPLTLVNGKHLLLVKGILDAGAGKIATLQASLKNKPAFAGVALQASLDAGRRSRMEDVLNTVNINEVQLSPDGRRVAVALSRLPRGGKGSQRWLEVLETKRRRHCLHVAGAGKRGQLFLAGRFAALRLHPRGKRPYRYLAS